MACLLMPSWDHPTRGLLSNARSWDEYRQSSHFRQLSFWINMTMRVVMHRLWASGAGTQLQIVISSQLELCWSLPYPPRAMSPSIDAPSTAFYPSENPQHPFNRTWRGTKQDSIRLDGIPKFDDPFAEREWIKVYVAWNHRTYPLFIIFRNIWLVRFDYGGN